MTKISSFQNYFLKVNSVAVDVTEVSSQEPSDKEVKKSIWKKIFPRTVFRSKREKQFVRKLDLWLLSWTSLAYFIKSIDQSNISSAYVSGMKETMGFHGKQYNYLDTCFKIGYAVFLIPSQIIMNKVNPAYWLSTCELLWGIFTALCSVPKTPNGLYPLRFFIGVFESSSWPGIIITLMNYYTKEELATRIGIFQSSYYLGNIITGFMQAGIYKTLDHKHGKRGYQWLFIINGAMTIVVALSGFFVLPDTPANGGARYWMNDEDREIALERMERVGRKTKRNFDFSQFYTCFSDWRMWLFISGYCTKAFCIAFQYFNLYLKSLKNVDGTKTWSVEQLNLIPIGGNAISLVAVIFWSKLADITQKPLHILVFLLGADLFSNIILAVWPKGNGIKYAAFFIIPVSDAFTSLFISFLAEVYTSSPEKRSIVTGTAVVLVYANNAWLPLVLWPADHAPHYKYGYKISILFIGIALISVVSYYHLVYKKSVKDNEEANKLLEHKEIPSNQKSESSVIRV